MNIIHQITGYVMCTALIAITLVSCNNVNSTKNDLLKKDDSEDYQALVSLPPSSTGVSFNNIITENETHNIITYDGLLQGAGVAVLDVNNDGLLDIYFAGNQVSDRLYLNQGGMKFEDITESSGITISDKWSTGIAIVDINEDGYDDIYVCKFLYDNTEQLKNALFINQKDNTFKEAADQYGIADPGYGIMANFFDYDNDGDLDLYVGNQPPNALALKAQMKNQKFPQFTDRLYRNDGRKFTNVTGSAGITNFSYTLSVTTFDYNKDGLKDIYVACDYDEPDFLYKNNGDGTFTNVIDDAMRHISNFSMGSDMADLNKDGNLDLYTVDMVAEDNYRQKTNMSGMNPERFWALANAGYHYQYMHNMLQLNNGDGSFSEIANLAQISNTDWSWAPLFIDFDLDRHHDIFITNGTIKETRNKDYTNWKKAHIEDLKKENGGALTSKDIMDISSRAPSVKVLNALYRNNGDLTFEHYENQWGLTEPSWSQGAAYADLDNDGDLDIVINNMNSEAEIFQNQAVEKGINNYLNVTLKGGPANSKGFGSIVEVFSNGEVFYNEMMPYRGYMSTNQSILNIGLGSASHVDSILVTWHDGKMSVLGQTKANQTIEIPFAKRSNRNKKYKSNDQLTFTPFGDLAQNKYKENDYDDYIDEVLIPHKMSTLGPFVTVGDVNGDGSDDFFISGAAGECGQMMIYTPSGYEAASGPWCDDKASEDGGVTLVDLDGDGDLDLVVSSGGNEFDEGSPLYADRIYENTGNASFKKVASFSGDLESSGPIVSIDYDNDGDLDLFIGGRQVPSKYGRPANSSLYRNDGGLSFTEVTKEVAPDFQAMGMVTDAVWTDLNGDGQEELMIVGEWMPIRIFSFNDGQFGDVTSQFGLDKTNGWWNSIDQVEAGGTQSFILGNLGLNMKFRATADEPFKVYVDDFDDNGTNDVYLGQMWSDGDYHPIRGRQCSSEQMPYIKKEFKNYDLFAKASFEEILGDRIDSTTVKNEVHTFESGILTFDQGKGSFEKLPNAAQISPIFGAIEMDVDRNGENEIIVVGNYYNREVETTRSDASNGQVISKKGNSVSQLSHYGMDGSGDVRAIERLKIADGSQMVLIAVNNDAVRLYQYNPSLTQ